MNNSTNTNSNHIGVVDFEPTKEQIDALVNFRKNRVLKISASAGSGKSSTLKFIAASHPELTFLYVAFNKSMAQEAAAKFPSNVRVMTIHSLAYRAIGKDFNHKLTRPTGRYINMAATGGEIAKFYGIFPVEDSQKKKLNEAYLGLIVKDTVNAFERSADLTLGEKHIPKFHLEDIEKRYDLSMPKIIKGIIKNSKSLWKDRSSISERVLCTHDTYLKLFELSKPELGEYDCVLVDEAQDTNEVMLSIFKRFKGKTVYVGDENQQIYAFRGGVNAMKKIEAPESVLSKSFRFGQAIADIAKVIVNKDIEGFEKVNSVVGEIDDEQPYTILYRKNITLIMEALELLTIGKKIFLNIDVRDFVNMLDSALNLNEGNLKKVKHESIVPYSTWGELCTDASTDPSLSKLVKIISEGRAEDVIQNLNLSQKDPNKAKIILTTAHKAKGLEWDQVVLAEDFKSDYNSQGKFQKVSEEDNNLLYVACTRAKKVLKINDVVEEKLRIYHAKNKSKTKKSDSSSRSGHKSKGLSLNGRLGVFSPGADSSVLRKFVSDSFDSNDNYMKVYENWLQEGDGYFFGELNLMGDLKKLSKLWDYDTVTSKLIEDLGHNIEMEEFKGMMKK